MKKLIVFLFFISLFIPSISFSRENISDWYIKDFQSEILINKDSSLLITEIITADCGNLPNKHGIFRILPTKTKTPEKTINNPIKLISITDFNGTPIKYSIIKNGDTITWKIGDPNIAVKGENYYKIVYKVENAIRFDNSEFDEFYWNLSGNFWDIEIDNFYAKIIIPEESRKDNKIELYDGYVGDKTKLFSFYRWDSNNVLEVFNSVVMKPGQGVTISLTFPKNIFTPYKPSIFGKIVFSLPILALIILFIFWKKISKEPKVDKTIIPEFEVPENISPIKMGALMSKAIFNNKFISASIINMAVKNVITIEEINKKILFFSNKDYILKRIKNTEEINGLDETEILILEKIFGNKNEIKISSLKTKFYKEILEIKESVKECLIKDSLITPFLFMAKRTLNGAELNWRIKGFKLYMETAEKYRQQFNEKENIFEKLLPYAMVFGIAKKWAKKMEMIYGQEYFANYHPIWFVGSFDAFNIDSFTSSLDSLSSHISSNMGSSSGVGGGGFSGGGGGGGGGGGW